MLLPNNLRRRLKVYIPTSNTRVSLARDIHDGIAQDLVAVGYQLDSILARPEVDQKTRSDLRNLRLYISQTLLEVRRSLFDLRRSATSLRDELTRLYLEICQNFSGEVDLEEVTLPESTQLSLIDITKELLTNAAQHSDAQSIWLRLITSDQHVVLSVIDDGKGGAQPRPSRFGLIGVRERVEELGGRYEMSGKRGTEITISLPL